MCKRPEIGHFWGLGSPGGPGSPPERWRGLRPGPNIDQSPIPKQFYNLLPAEVQPRVLKVKMKTEIEIPPDPAQHPGV